MNNNFEVVLGIEIHAELKTNQKLFSTALRDFSKEANTNINDQVLGYPGSKPILNRQAVDLAMRLASIFNSPRSGINPDLRWDRKSYFYPDLPKGFQITQFAQPFMRNGRFEFFLNDKPTNVTISEMHLEEDTAKQNHDQNISRLDYNRSGNPLIEIVTDHISIDSQEKAVAYVTELRKALYFYQISDARMHEGSMRCDVNISIRPKGFKGYGTRIEIKNINTTTNVGKAIESEFAAQLHQYLKNETIVQSTKRFDEATKKTVLMRAKGGENDYRYIAETNLLPISMKSILDSWFILDPNSKHNKTSAQFFENKWMVFSKKIYELGLDKLEIDKISNNDMLNKALITLTDFIDFMDFENYKTDYKSKSFDKFVNTFKDKESKTEYLKVITKFMTNDAANLVKTVFTISEKMFDENTKWFNQMFRNFIEKLWLNLFEIVFAFKNKSINSNHSKELIQLLETEATKVMKSETGSIDIDLILNLLNSGKYQMITDKDQISKMIDEIVNSQFKENPKPFESYLTNPKGAEGKVLGPLMKLSNNSIDPQLASSIVKEYLTKRFSS